jgi:hypothetical protein
MIVYLREDGLANNVSRSRDFHTLSYINPVPKLTKQTFLSHLLLITCQDEKHIGQTIKIFVDAGIIDKPFVLEFRRLPLRTPNNSPGNINLGGSNRFAWIDKLLLEDDILLQIIYKFLKTRDIFRPNSCD